MKLKEFFNHTKIPMREFAGALEIPVTTLRTYVYEHRKPPIDVALKIIRQTNFHVTLEDLVGDLLGDWEPKEKIKTMGKIEVSGTKMKKHERTKYYTDIDNI